MEKIRYYNNILMAFFLLLCLSKTSSEPQSFQEESRSGHLLEIFGCSAKNVAMVLPLRQGQT
jgi:hypothetical protein